MVVWKEQFRNHRVMVHTDNTGLLFAINMLSSRSESVIKLLNFLVLHCMRFNIWLKACDIAGINNTIAYHTITIPYIADALSRFQFQRFRELVPLADRHGTPCPDCLWGLIWE